MSRHAVCYTATSGYLFATAVSAIQARTRVGGSTDVFVCYLGDEESLEKRSFEQVCAQHSIGFLATPASILGGLHPIYARLFLDQILPPRIEEVLYLDGDTQIVGDIDELVHADPPIDGALGVRDPMVFIRRANAVLGRKIESWWDRSGIPCEMRDTYINSGVLRIGRASLGALRSDVLATPLARRQTFRFPDQDAVNLALRGRLGTISMKWNFPGFLLNTQIAKSTAPSIIHFMSDPRPWNAPLPPWGQEYFEPYRRLVRDHPELERYWPRFGQLGRARYGLQQYYKHLTERRSWQSRATADLVSELEQDCYRLRAG